jgi:hypothetical protein
MLKFLAANIGLTETELQPALQLANTQLGKGIHSHNGQNPGYHAYLAWDTQRQIGVVVLANAAVDIDELGLQLMRGFSLTPVSVDPQILDAYAGRYQTSDGLVVTIRVDGARIFLQIPRAPGYEPFAGEHELQAITDDRFYLRGADFEIAFFRNDRGGVDRMEAVVQGETYDATRIP